MRSISGRVLGMFLMSTGVLLFCATADVHAMGVGRGRTKIDFQVKLGDATSSRLFAKLDVSGAVTSNGNSFFAQGDQSSGNGHGKGKGNHGHSNNFALAGYQVTLMIGSATFTATADDKGKTSAPFTAKLTANGAILQIKANGLNLESLFPIDPTDGKHQVAVEIKVTALKTALDSSGLATTIVSTLSDQTVTFNYTVKNGRARGSNF